MLEHFVFSRAPTSSRVRINGLPENVKQSMSNLQREEWKAGLKVFKLLHNEVIRRQQVEK